MNKTKLAKYVFGAAMLVASPAIGQELDGTLKKIGSSGIFTLGYLESAPPFSFPGPDKCPVGFSIDLCTRVANAIQKQLGTNLKLNWVPVTVENRIDLVVQGKVDIECSTTTASLSRRERVDFSLMTFVDGGSFLTLAASGLNAIAELAGSALPSLTAPARRNRWLIFSKSSSLPLNWCGSKIMSKGVRRWKRARWRRSLPTASS